MVDCDVSRIRTSCLFVKDPCFVDVSFISPYFFIFLDGFVSFQNRGTSDEVSGFFRPLSGDDPSLPPLRCTSVFTSSFLAGSGVVYLLQWWIFAKRFVWPLVSVPLASGV